MEDKKHKNKTEYNPGLIEKKWQKVWEENGFYRAEDPPAGGSKFYLLIEFPYPSGAGLHVGHVRSWSAMDAYARRKRMEGYNVLYPIGWDAFGLPAENYAIKMGVHPSKIVPQNIAKFRVQCKSLGLSFDWSREIDTTDSKYYKWTQWIFLKFLEKGLAYQADVPVNWCPECKTNLADEEVLSDGTHERCGTKTEKRMQKQWLLRITKYADRLLSDLKTIDYPQMVARQQINWIGKKEGINIKYPISNIQHQIECFTTRPDTNFGATFIVIGPEHPLVASLLKSNPPAGGQKSKLEEIRKYVEKAKQKSEIERIAEGRKKTGVFTGLYAINKLNGKKLPIWVSDFVLGQVGTGAVVGVPGHDKRDFEFAQTMKLPIVRVVVGPDGDTSPITRIEQVQEEAGTMVNSEFLNGLQIHRAISKMMDYLEEKGWGKRMITYHLRDWVFSRQHYWGEPIPVIHCKKCGIVPVPEKDLPMKLPYLEKYEPTGTGESPLANASTWVNVSCPKCGQPARRETDTMPNWAGSNWYYLAYLFANKLEDQRSKKDNVFSENQELIKFWMPVDLYQGGFEHTTLHLLYSRFVYKFLFDIGVVSTVEPYTKRRVHGIVLGPDGRKMSKSFGNIINPDEIVRKFGADTLRLYEMFMGPFDQTIAWSDEGVEGCYRFLKRVWRLFNEKISGQSDQVLITKLHKTIKKVGEDIEEMKFNTAVAAMMEFSNAWHEASLGLSKDDAARFLLILAPFAPHMAEELWLRHKGNQRKSIHMAEWPKWDEKYLVHEEVTIVIQVNGKRRGEIKNQKSKIKNQKEVEEKARKEIEKYIKDKDVRNVIYVEGKIINFVTS